ncbi:ArnT family glycosyltransferase [Gorillibacterium timonense]|uniref:ArnT family glycosyltransferase n=1 Tax=Gorillibacterium timonense TaxID=1689269 RepID=UPI00071C4895|nr:glycosyltransferase family 39 protein [Gorillibacterium timonense]
MATRSRNPKRICLWVLALTLALKVILVLVAGARFDYHSDDQEYLRSARILLEQGTLTYNDPSRPTAFITPAYPGFLALVMQVTGTGPEAAQAVRILQAVMITAALWLLYRIGCRLFDERTALLAVILCSLYPPLWLISNFVFTESLFILALFLLFRIALRAEERPTLGSALLFGLAWAAAVYIRPTVALWPGVFFLLLAFRKRIPFRRLLRCGIVSALVFTLCLAPWWARNERVSGGEYIPLTKSSGNPLLLGTYPWTVPALFLDEQRTWHSTDNLWVNDEQDTQHAIERLKDGFSNRFWVYASWYTIGKFLLFWGDVFYWLPLPGIPLAAAVVAHYLLLIPGFIGLWRNRKQGIALSIITLLGYFSLLHMIYLPHSRYALPLMPLVILFAASEYRRRFSLRRSPPLERVPTP